MGSFDFLTLASLPPPKVLRDQVAEVLAGYPVAASGLTLSDLPKLLLACAELIERDEAARGSDAKRRLCLDLFGAVLLRVPGLPGMIREPLIAKVAPGLIDVIVGASKGSTKLNKEAAK